MDAGIHDSENLRNHPNPIETKTRENKEMNLIKLSLPTFLQFSQMTGLQDWDTDFILHMLIFLGFLDLFLHATNRYRQFPRLSGLLLAVPRTDHNVGRVSVELGYCWDKLTMS